MARIAVTGPGGGLGANVVAAAAALGHDVAVLVRDPARAPRTDATLHVVVGDATSSRDVERVARGADVLIHCANPPFVGDWSGGQTRMAEAAVAAALETGARLVFPANVWVFGPGTLGQRVADDAPFAPASRKGEARAAIETRIRTSGARFTIARIAEFYGPSVTTLTALALRSIGQGKAAYWFGPPDVAVEFAYMPDVGAAMVAAATHPDCEGRTVNVPTSGVTTPRAFLEQARLLAGGGGSTRFVPAVAVKAASLVSARARALTDVLHLWTHPIVLDTAAWRDLGLPMPQTDYASGLAATLSWLRGQPSHGREPTAPRPR